MGDNDLLELVSDLILKIEHQNKLIELLETKVDVLSVQLTSIRINSRKTSEDFETLKSRFDTIKNNVSSFQEDLDEFEHIYLGSKPVDTKPLLKIG